MPHVHASSRGHACAGLCAEFVRLQRTVPRSMLDARARCSKGKERRGSEGEGMTEEVCLIADVLLFPFFVWGGGLQWQRVKAGGFRAACVLQRRSLSRHGNAGNGSVWSGRRFGSCTAASMFWAFLRSTCCVLEPIWNTHGGSGANICGICSDFVNQPPFSLLLLPLCAFRRPGSTKPPVSPSPPYSSGHKPCL